MFSQKICAFALLFCIIIYAIAFSQCSEMFWAHGNLPRRESIVEITMKADKTEVGPEETVCLDELIPSTMNAEVRGISHTALRIGYFNKQLSKLVNIEKSSLFGVVDVNKEFDGLPGNLGFSHPYDFEVKTPRYKGAEFTFRPKRLGVHLITSSWFLSDKGTHISSTPVVLVVKPPLDAHGRAIVKPEWVKREE